MDVVVQIISVTVRTISSGQVYDVACSDGQTRQVWTADLAQAINAYANTGQSVTLRVTHKANVKNGKTYNNYSIQEFAPPGVQLPPDTNAQAAPMGATPLPHPQPGTLNTAPIAAAPKSDGGYSPETVTRISKLASYETAAGFVTALFTGAGPDAYETGKALIDDLALHIYKRARSHELPQSTTVAANPQAVAEFVNTELPGTVQVGAPVAAAQDAAAEAPQAEPAADNIDWG